MSSQEEQIQQRRANLDALGTQELALENLAPAVPAESAAGCNHPVTGHVGTCTPAHGVADGTRRAGTSGREAAE